MDGIALYADSEKKERDLFTLMAAPIQRSSVKRKKVELYDTVIYTRLSDGTDHKVQITTKQSEPEKGLINKDTALAIELMDTEEGEEVEVNGKLLEIKEIIKASKSSIIA